MANESKIQFMSAVRSGPAPYPLTEQEAKRLENIFTYHKPKEDQLERYQALRVEAYAFAILISELTPPGRERALALTKLEECVMHANSAIARRE